MNRKNRSFPRRQLACAPVPHPTLPTEKSPRFWQRFTSFYSYIFMVLWMGIAGAVWPQLVSAFQAPQGSPQLDLPRIRLAVGMHIIEVQVASEPNQQQIGLMYRKSMPENEGMLFDFGQAGPRCFWMKNTLIPLTAAFIDDAGRIINFADMKPLSEKSHCASRPARYVLEMNQGWFQKRRIQVGQAIRAAK